MKNKSPRRFLNKYNKDYYGGGLILIIGLWAIYQGFTYQMGTLNQMGPGFFPVAVGAVMALMGVLIARGARSAVPAGEYKYIAPEWRGWFCITFSIIAFIVLGRYGGLLPATFAVVFIAALGDRENRIGCIWRADRDAGLAVLSR